MENYKEKQIGWLVIAIVLVGFLWSNGYLTYLYIYQIGNNPITTTGFIIVNFILFVSLILPLLLFYQMQTIVFDNRIVVIYGFGIIKRTFYFREISKGHLKRTPWWYGAGIRYYPNGTLYSINFTNAAEFKLKNKNKYISIGSKTPELLIGIINQEIENNQ